MSEFNYFPINLEKQSYQIPIDSSLKSKQFSLKSPTIKIFTYATFFSLILPTLNDKQFSEITSANTYHVSSESVAPINMNRDVDTRNKNAITINLNKLIEKEAETQKEIEKMQNEIKAPITKFEDFVIKLGLFLASLFLVLSLPVFIGYPSLVGVLMSFGLLVFVKIRKWERGE